MKPILTILLGLTLCLSVVGAEKKTDVERDGYKGPVKSVKYSRENLLHKNDHGWGLLRVEKRPLGFENKNVHEAIKYDEKGNEIERLLYMGRAGLATLKLTYKYDANGRRVSGATHDASGIIERSSFKCDAKGNIVEKANYDISGKLKFTVIYEYDGRGNVLREIDRDTNGKPISKKTYKYDDQGKLLEESSDYPGFGLAYKYDEKGNFLIKHPLGLVLRSNPPSPPSNNPITNEPSPIKKPIIGKDILKYDEKGNLVEWAWPSVNGKITSKNIYKYDVEGNRIKETSYKLKSGSGEQLVPMNEETWEFTYWD